MKNIKKIRLRALTIEDLPFTLKWNNQDDINELYSGHPFPVNKEMETIWYEKILVSNIPSSVFGIEEESTHELIGISVLKDINLINRSAEFAIYIGEKNKRGKGFSKEATISTLDFGFNKIGLKRIWLKVLEENEVAKELYRKTGFITEGVLRSSVFKNGSFKNEILMSILSNEFNK